MLLVLRCSCDEPPPRLLWLFRWRWWLELVEGRIRRAAVPLLRLMVELSVDYGISGGFERGAGLAIVVESAVEEKWLRRGR